MREQLLAQISQNHIKYNSNAELCANACLLRWLVSSLGCYATCYQSFRGQAVILEWNLFRSCKIKSPHLHPPAFLSFSVLYFCNWRCHNEINSVVITDFTSCYLFPLEEAATWRRLKIFLFHASSISSLYEGWASGCVYCFHLNATWQGSILPVSVTHCFFCLLCNFTFADMQKALIYHTVKQVVIKLGRE